MPRPSRISCLSKARFNFANILLTLLSSLSTATHRTNIPSRQKHQGQAKNPTFYKERRHKIFNHISDLNLVNIFPPTLTNLGPFLLSLRPPTSDLFIHMPSKFKVTFLPIQKKKKKKN